MEPIVFTSVTQSPEECPHILGIQQICANGRNEGMNERRESSRSQAGVCLYNLATGSLVHFSDEEAEAQRG